MKHIDKKRTSVVPDFAPSTYTVSIGRSFVTGSQTTAAEKSTPRKAGRSGTRQIENCGGAMAVARAGIPAREMDEKRLISAGVYRPETFVAAILQREAYVPTDRSFGAVHIREDARRLDAAGVGVTIAFYKVRDSAAGMRVRCTSVLSTPGLPVLRPFSAIVSFAFQPRDRNAFQSLFAVAVAVAVAVAHCRGAVRRTLAYILDNERVYSIEYDHFGCPTNRYYGIIAAPLRI